MQQISGRDALSAIAHFIYLFIYFLAEVLLLIAAPCAECRNSLMGPICICEEEKGLHLFQPAVSKIQEITPTTRSHTHTLKDAHTSYICPQAT